MSTEERDRSTDRQSDSSAKTEVVSMEDKCKDFKENLSPSFQELDVPDPRPATIGAKVEQLKSKIEAEAEQIIPRAQTAAAAQAQSPQP